MTSSTLEYVLTGRGGQVRHVSVDESTEICIQSAPVGRMKKSVYMIISVTFKPQLTAKLNFSSILF